MKSPNRKSQFSESPSHLIDQKEQDYTVSKTPTEYEDGALAAGGAPSVFSWNHFGVCMHFGVVTFLYSIQASIIYSVINVYYQSSGSTVATANALKKTPHVFRFLTGILADCWAIYGYKKRPLMVIGWVLAFAGCSVMAIYPLGDAYYTDSSLLGTPLADMTEEQLKTVNTDAPNSSFLLIALMFTSRIGTNIADGPAYAYIVELSQREPESVRGTSQAKAMFMRHVFGAVGSFFAGFGLNSAAYGGDFSWDIGYNNIMWICAAATFLCIITSWFCMTEEKTTSQSLMPFLRKLYEQIQSRALYQFFLYLFLRQILTSMNSTAQSLVQETWAGVTPLNDGLASMLSSALTACSLLAFKFWGLDWNWRYTIAGCEIFVVLLDAIPTFITVFDVFRSQWFWLGMPLLEEFPDIIGDFMSTLYTVEVTDPGYEGTITSIMVTVRAVANPFATMIYKSIDSYFDVTRKFIREDTDHARIEVAYTYIIAYAFHLCVVFLVLLMPTQKSEAQKLKRTGGKSKALGIATLVYLGIAFCWAVMTNILSLSTSTKCLRIAGGKGC